MQVLIVEDEEALTTLLRYNLEAEGFLVDSAARGDDELAKAAGDRYVAKMSQLFNPDWSGIYVTLQADLKAFMNLLGLPGGYPRLPILPIDAPFNWPMPSGYRNHCLFMLISTARGGSANPLWREFCRNVSI